METRTPSLQTTLPLRRLWLSSGVSPRAMRYLYVLFVVAILLTGCANVPRESFATLQQRAEAGDAVAQRRLGSRFDFGSGVKQNYSEAAKWYQKAADQGDAAAQNNLGSFHQYGLGVSTNFSKALELYSKSADQGFAMAENNLGLMYDSGLGV